MSIVVRCSNDLLLGTDISGALTRLSALSPIRRDDDLVSELILILAQAELLFNRQARPMIKALGRLQPDTRGLSQGAHLRRARRVSATTKSSAKRHGFFARHSLAQLYCSVYLRASSLKPGSRQFEFNYHIILPSLLLRRRTSRKTP